MIIDLRRRLLTLSAAALGLSLSAGCGGSNASAPAGEPAPQTSAGDEGGGEEGSCGEEGACGEEAESYGHGGYGLRGNDTELGEGGDGGAIQLEEATDEPE